MASVRISVNIDVDGEPVRGFPIVRRFEPVDRDSFESTLATNALFVALPATGQVGSVQALLFQAVGATMAFKLAGDGTGITLNKGGLVLVLDSSGFTGTTVQNNSGAGAKAQGFVVGT